MFLFGTKVRGYFLHGATRKQENIMKGHTFRENPAFNI